MMGGIDTDAGTATSLAGLFAAGECACVSINGANRLGSNSLSEILVFGAAAGRAAAAHALEAKTPTANPVARLVRDETRRIEAGYLRERKGRRERMADIRKAMQRTMDALVGVFRTEASLKQACADLAELRSRFQRVRLDDRSRVFNTELTAALELGFMLDVAEAIAHSALARRESRGAHARRDYPTRDDRHYLAHTLAYQDAEAPPRLEYRPVTITQWRPQPRTY